MVPGVAAGNHQRHAAVRRAEVGQAVADLEAHARHMGGSDVEMHAHVAVPVAFRVRLPLGMLVDQRGVGDVEVGAQELDDQRHGGGMGRQFREGRFLHQAGAPVRVVALEFEAFHQPVSGLQEPLDGGTVQSVAHDQVPLLGKGASLVIGERRVLHGHERVPRFAHHTSHGAASRGPRAPVLCPLRISVYNLCINQDIGGAGCSRYRLSLLNNIRHDIRRA